MPTSIPEILDDLRNGKMIILVDDEDRENEGDLVIAADKVTPEAINFMATYGRGLICMPLTPERIEALARRVRQRHESLGLEPKALALRHGKSGETPQAPIWTDDYSDLFGLLRRRGDG